MTVTAETQTAPPLPTPLMRAIDRLTPAAIPGTAMGAWLACGGVTFFAFLLRFLRLAVPGKVVFDEVYYSFDAQSLLKYGYEHGHEDCVIRATDGAGFVVHPPLGKWAIALGEAIWGYDCKGGPTAAFGWRISACVFGALSVLIVCRMGRRLFRSTLLGCVAGLLLALDGLHFVQSRVAMLDIFVMFWVVAAAACLVADRDWQRRRLAQRLLVEDDRAYGPSVGFPWWRLSAGLCLGAALGTKWSALYYVVALLLLTLAWDVGARRTAGVRMPFRAALLRHSGSLALGFVVVPIAVYLLSWTGWFATDGGWRRTCGEQWKTECGPVAGFVKYHDEIWDFHKDLKSRHPYASRPFTWLVLGRPVSYFYTSPKTGQLGCTAKSGTCAKEILAVGTPAIWWGSIIALFVTIGAWVARRDWRASFILVGFAAGYLPWFWPPERTEFLFYALPSVPFMCLALTYAFGLALGWRRRWAAWALGGYVALVAWNFFYLYPVLAARVIPYADWQDRMWFSSWI